MTFSSPQIWSLFLGIAQIYISHFCREILIYVPVKMNGTPRLLHGNLVEELWGRDTPVLPETEETHVAGTGSHFARETRLMSCALMSRVLRKATFSRVNTQVLHYTCARAMMRHANNPLKAMINGSRSPITAKSASENSTTFKITELHG